MKAATAETSTGNLYGGVTVTMDTLPTAGIFTRSCAIPAGELEHDHQPVRKQPQYSPLSSKGFEAIVYSNSVVVIPIHTIQG